MRRAAGTFFLLRRFAGYVACGRVHSVAVWHLFPSSLVSISAEGRVLCPPWVSAV
jgi:hypothetical protein